MGIAIDKENTKFLNLLLIADLAFISVHCFYLLGIVTGPLYSIETDMGYAEIYQYIKECWIVVLLFILAIDRRRIIYLSWSLLFMYLLFDDSLQIHERLGEYLAQYFELKPMFGLRAQDFGELGVSMLFGFLLFSFIGASYLVSDNLEKQISKRLFILVVLLACFGIFVDILHTAIPWDQVFELFGLLEDGAEMIIVSFIVWFTFSLGKSQVNPSEIQGNN
ncbi:hypothetical protein [Algoriphagus marinus]|uniref:hypothetical protein n=1 Tax=Algoriphagus marinus TaxID=1925762 RepID=UPI0015881C6E|nr:hypothetical protein [Algoriphagus marinus]